MALVEGIFADIALSDIEQNYDIEGPLALARDGRWLSRLVLGEALSPGTSSVITHEWVQITNKIAAVDTIDIRNARSGRELALVEPINNARLEVVKRFGWTQQGGLFAEVAEQEVLSVQELPRCSHLFQVLRILFACTGTRLMEPLVNDKRNNPDKPPALAYKSPVHLKVQLGILLKAEISSADIGLVLIGFPDLFSQRIQSRHADETLVLRARTFLNTGDKASSGSARISSRRTGARHTVETPSPGSFGYVLLDELTTEP